MSSFDDYTKNYFQQKKKKKTFDEYTRDRKKEQESFATFEEYTKAKFGEKDSDKKEKKLTITNNIKETIDTKEDIAPVAEDKKLKFFKKGAFEDGKQKGDLVKTILGSAADAGIGIAKGVGGLGEGIVDLMRYGVAEGAEAIGKDDYARKVKMKANQNSVEDFFGKAEKEVDKYSVFDRTSDAVMQGLGQVGAIILTGGVAGALGASAAGATAVTSGVMGLSSAGSGMREAYLTGASDKEAATYGISKGIIDAGTEALFGGLGKAVNAIGLSRGLSSLDDIFARKLSSRLSNQVHKNIAEFGVKASAEGVEELLAGLGSAAAKKLTYMEDEELGKLIEDENLLEQFVVGTVTSGMIQSGYIPAMKRGSLHEANQQNKDFISGYTQNEQKVIDKEIENRITERETDGKKLTNKEKAAIEEQVKKDLEKGYIGIDTIESALGGETYNKYKSITDHETKLQEEYDALHKMKRGDMTGEQIDRETEVKKQLEELKNKDERTQIKEKISKTVQELAKVDRLSESYNEKSRRSQAFEADLTKYDTKQQDVIKKAAESGILNNTNRTHEFVDMIAKISADKGVSFDFINNAKLKESGFALADKIVNGYVKDGSVAINIDSNKALNTVVGHEITHVLEGTELYTELQNVIKEYAITKGEYQTRYDALAELYKDVDGTVIENEITADLVGEYLFTDSEFVSRLSVEQPNIFKRVYEEIKYMVKCATGTKESKQLLGIQRMFEKIYKQDTKENPANGEVRYSISEIKDENNKSYGIGVRLDSNFLEGLSSDERIEITKEYVKELGGQVFGAYDSEGNGVDITIVPSTYYKDHNGKRKPANKDLRDKYNKNENKQGAIALIDELILTSEKTGVKPAKYSHGWIDNNGNNDWEYWTTYLEDKEGKIWEATLNIATTENGEKMLYDISPIKKVGQSIKLDTLPTNDRIAQYSEKVNEDYSTTEDGENQKNKDTFLEVAVSKDPSRYVQDELQSNASSNNIIAEDEINTTTNAEYDLSVSRNKDIAPTGNYNVYGKDIALEAPARENASVQKSSLSDNVGIFDESKSVSEIDGDELTKKDAQKIKNIQAKIQGFRLTKDLAKQEFDKKIAEKTAEYETLKRKDTKKAVDLNNQIVNLESRKNSILQDMDNKIERHNKAINNIEVRSRFRKRQTKQQEYRNIIGELIGDTSTWTDKKIGLQYQTNTLRRNLRDIVRDENGKRNLALADRIYDELQGKYNHNEALMNRELNELRQKYRDMKITKAEDSYIQMLGELRYNPSTELTKDVVNEFYDKNKKSIDVKKVNEAIESARTLYDSLYNRVNEVLREQGFKEIEYRKGYFPHFTEEKQNIFEKLLNWKTQNNEIPTDIAGLTEEFNPQRSWQSFNKRRTSDVTDYSFMKGLDSYSKGALDWIYHIEDIQKRRAFENEIRYRHSDKGLQAEIDKIRNNPLLTAEEAQDMIDNKFKEARNPLGNFLNDFRNGTNNLVGKKSTTDRSMEYATNRQIYSIMTNLSNRTTGNMVAGSVSSALTNFIPITQSWGQVSPVSSLVAMKDTIKSVIKDDGTVGKSDFLTNRLNSAENLYKSGWDKINDKVSIMMDIVDGFTSQVVWRSKYMENLKNGMSENESVRNADQFAENVIAGRSRGNMPTIFNAKNPITKVFTAFQLEVANQYEYMLKDMPQDLKNEAKHKLVKGYATMFIGAYVYNALLSTITGRDSAFDPIRIVLEFLGDLGDDEEETMNAIGNLASNIVDEIPYIGGLMGGGRIPISSAIPYDDPVSMVSGTAQDIADKDWENLKNEWSNPLYYLAAPMGGGQIRKSIQGLSMFSEKHPVSGSYTASGSLRFPVENTFMNKLQAGIFGQYASENARQYFDNDWAPLKEKQVLQYKAMNVPIEEYRKYRKEISDIEADKDSNGKSISGSKKEKVFNYIEGLDIPYEAKILLYKFEYNSDDTYNQEIIDYLNTRADITDSEMEKILAELGFEVDVDGTVRW